jgi:hypothetical protein
MAASGLIPRLARSPGSALVLLGLAAAAWAAAPAAWPGHGLRASFWDDRLEPQGEPDLVTTVRDWSISMDGNRASSNQTVWCVRFEGLLELPEAGEWSFRTDSDDGSRLWIGDRLVVDNAGIHPRRVREGRASLAAGRHPLRLEFSENLGESYLRLELRPPGGSWRGLPLAWVRPEAPGPEELARQTGQRRLRLGLLCLAGLLAAAAVGLRLAARGPAWWATWRAPDGRRRAWTRLKGRAWAQDAIVVALCLPFYLQTIGERLPHEPYMKGDSIYYANTAVSLLRDLDLDQRNQTDRRIFEELKSWTQIPIAHSNIARGLRGEWYPKHPIVMPVLSVPFLAAFGGLGFVIYNLASLLLLVIAMRRLASRVARPGLAAVAAVAIGLTPLLHNFAYSYSPDILSALLCVAGLHLVAGRRGILGGLLLGLAVWVKLPNALLGALLGLGLVGARDWRLFGRLALGGGLSLGAFGALNTYQFGAPWLTSYQRVWVVENGVSRVGDHLASLGRPFWEGFQMQLFHQHLGLMATATAGVLGWLGLRALWRRRPLMAWSSAAFALGTFLFYCVYDYTHASHFSNRFLMPAVALASLPLAALLEALAPDRAGLTSSSG